MGRAATTGDGVNWLTLAGHRAVSCRRALAALFRVFSWQRLAVMAVLYVLAINVGIGMGYHRSSRIADTKCPSGWIRADDFRHQRSKADRSSGSRRIGFITSSATRTATRIPRAKAEVGARRLHPFWRSAAPQTAVLARYSPDLSRDRFHVWLSKYHWLPITVSGLLLFAGGWLWGGWVNGVAMVLWGVLLRVTLGLHATWLVNSATHLWGSRRFKTRDDSRNNWWVALLTGGEGWHNNHHAHPVSARHGLAWYEIDPNFWGIWLLAKIGLARKIQVAKFDPADPSPPGTNSRVRRMECSAGLLAGCSVGLRPTLYRLFRKRSRWSK